MFMNVQQVNEESWLSHEENGKHEQTKKVNVREEIDISVKLYIDTSNINKLVRFWIDFVFNIAKSRINLLQYIMYNVHALHYFLHLSFTDLLR